MDRKSGTRATSKSAAPKAPKPKAKAAPSPAAKLKPAAKKSDSVPAKAKSSGGAAPKGLKNKGSAKSSPAKNTASAPQSKGLGKSSKQGSASKAAAGKKTAGKPTGKATAKGGGQKAASSGSSAKSASAKKGTPPKKPATSAKTANTLKAAPQKQGPKASKSLRVSPVETLYLSVEADLQAHVLRPKSFPDLPVEKDFGFPDSTPDLPSAYDRDTLVLMAQDPQYFFAYWELTPSLFELRSLEKVDGHEYAEVLKLNWEPRSLFDQNFRFIPISFQARRWYLAAPFENATLDVELGWLGDQGHFIPLLRSNTAQNPETWEKTKQRLQSAQGALQASVRQIPGLGASEHLTGALESANSHEWDIAENLFSGSSAGFSGSWSLGYPAAQPQGSEPEMRTGPATHAFRLSGQLLPGTRVKVDGHAVSVEDDGHMDMSWSGGTDVLRIDFEGPGTRKQTLTYDLTGNPPG